MIRTLIAEAVVAGARRWRACEVLGLSVRTVERWGTNDEDGRHGPNHVPANKLSEVERQKAVDVMTSPEFRDCSPKQIVPALASRGEYIGSEPTLYRILHEQDMQHPRGRERAPMSARQRGDDTHPRAGDGPDPRHRGAAEQREPSRTPPLLRGPPRPHCTDQYRGPAPSFQGQRRAFFA